MTAWRKAAFGPLLLLFLTSPSFGEEADFRLKALEDCLTGQEQTIDEQRKMIEELKTEVKQTQPQLSLQAPLPCRMHRPARCDSRYRS